MINKLQDVFSPDDPQTPDTSDHSSDDWKSLVDTVERGSSATPLDHWTAERKTKLRELALGTFLSLIQGFYDVQLDEVIKEATKLEEFLTSNWITTFIIHSVAPCDIFEDFKVSACTLLGENFVKIVNIEQLFKFSTLQEQGWSKDDIEILQILSTGTDLLWLDLQAVLPHKSLSEVKRVNQVLPTLKWTTKEKELVLKAHEESLHYLVGQLPFRKLPEIERFLLDNFPIEFDEYDTEYVEEALVKDFTYDYLEAYFAEPLSVLYSKIRSVYDLETIPLSRAEKSLLNSAAKRGLPIEDFIEDLPCRSFKLIEAQYKLVQFISTRKTTFTTPMERLIYEAQWTVLDTNANKRGSRSAREKHVETVETSRPTLTVEEIERRRLSSEKHKKLAAERKQRKKARQEADRLRRAANPRQKKTLLSEVLNGSLKSLLAGLEHFLSQSTEKQLGQKRRRVELSYNVNEYSKKQELIAASERNREQLAKLKKFEPPIKITKKRIVIEEPVIVVVKKEEKKKVFSPTDINTDSLVPLAGRPLFELTFYQSNPEVPNLNFVDLTDTSVYDVMTLQDDRQIYEDDIGRKIITSHEACYRSLPASFPPYLDPGNDNAVNPKNIIRIRFLLYPQHSELFILCEPKSNELNPIHEIIKLIMIHYGLYFSHSRKLKRIITKYCDRLEAAIEENDFSEFMFVIDSWNELMSYLSPNESISKITDDLNPEIREYLSLAEQRIPTVDELQLDMFYQEITFEPASPKYNIVSAKPRTLKTSTLSREPTPGITSTCTPGSVSNVDLIKKPAQYKEAFFARLCEKSKVSRFTIHQILQRAYSRVVSIASRKLRSYKSFTAEVYGELLPSFTSEVLSKVELKPEHKFYDLGSGVGNTTFQAALEFGASVSGGCELMDHALNLTRMQECLLLKYLRLFGLQQMNLQFALLQSFVDNPAVRKIVLDCDVLIVNNYLFDVNLNGDVGKLLFGLRPGTKIISLKNFVRPRYKASGDTIFDKLKVEKHEMSEFCSVSWTASKVPYYISTVQESVLPEYLHSKKKKDIQQIR